MSYDPRHHLNDLAARAGEHFNDYLIIARTGDGLIWRESNRTFGIGAIRRYDTIVSSLDMPMGEDDRL